ncbi:uncharacterized protein LOC110229260 [Arabidopsis lyrata subsp. lyrata]|uniref:uncharacterized protein LOC110229260 n=1 Tax=Arabidopsis lyrata subsp. lyrata TaxID=81972 RepID=UPI000A29CDDF|nr:uncharacterized protein LOC110229260 [Arabidopsis lyrata subsp. lyrata]|eukprot:XP_020884672.1 uncharacterized protein LOC110229260 [Arabidopsis lyrata subsp. lyrata]
MAQLLDWIGSDHRPLLLQTENNKWKGMRQFRYDNRWRYKQDVHMALQNTWDQGCKHLPPQQFYEALKRCRNDLSRWKSEQNLNSHKLIQQLHHAIQKAIHLEPVLQHIQPKVTEEMNQHLTKPVSEEEIYRALSHMNVDKAPGPDGLNAGFYKYHWNTVKAGVINFIKCFFQSGYLDPALNHTYICLVPVGVGSRTRGPGPTKDCHIVRITAHKG